MDVTTLDEDTPTEVLTGLTQSQLLELFTETLSLMKEYRHSMAVMTEALEKLCAALPTAPKP